MSFTHRRRPLFVFSGPSNRPLFIDSSFTCRHVSASRVVGYDIYLTEDKERPLPLWRHLGSVEASLAVTGLTAATTYFVRVDVRLVDGSLLKTPAVYRFKTMGQVDSLIHGLLLQISHRSRFVSPIRYPIETPVPAV